MSSCLCCRVWPLGTFLTFSWVPSCDLRRKTFVFLLSIQQIIQRNQKSIATSQEAIYEYHLRLQTTDCLSHRAICTRKISFQEQVDKRNMGNDFMEILWHLLWSSFRKIFINDTVFFLIFTVTLIYMSFSFLLDEAVIKVCSQRPGTAGLRNIWPRFLCPWWKFADLILQSRDPFGTFWLMAKSSWSTPNKQCLKLCLKTLILKDVICNSVMHFMSFSLCTVWAEYDRVKFTGKETGL